MRESFKYYCTVCDQILSTLTIAWSPVRCPVCGSIKTDDRASMIQIIKTDDEENECSDGHGPGAA